MTFFPSRAVAVEIMGFSVHWYGVMYMLAFLLAFFLLPRLERNRGLLLSDDDRSAAITSAIFGVIVGGRIGYVLFYAPSYFLNNPAEVFAVWHGGMSSHGGFIGVAVALWLTLRQRRIPVLPFLDVIAVPVALGLMLGRLGNFINQELYGTVTTLPWGIAIPGVAGLRHPTQIYAMIKDVSIAIVCLLHLTMRPQRRSGETFSLFLMMYGVLRFFVEYLRDQQVAPIVIGTLSLSRGQALTIPIFLVGLMLWLWVHRREFA